MRAGALLIPGDVHQDWEVLFYSTSKLYGEEGPSKLNDLKRDGRELLIRFMLEADAHISAVAECAIIGS